MQVQVYQYVKSTNELPKIFKSIHKVNYMLFTSCGWSGSRIVHCVFPWLCNINIWNWKNRAKQNKDVKNKYIKISSLRVSIKSIKSLG